jgi:hypothetical protein
MNVANFKYKNENIRNEQLTNLENVTLCYQTEVLFRTFSRN